MSQVEIWRDRIQAWQRSGLSRAAFCRGEGLKTWNFNYWHRLACSSKEASRAMVPVVIASSAASTVMAEVLLQNGLTVRVPIQANEQQVARLVRSLCSC